MEKLPLSGEWVSAPYDKIEDDPTIPITPRAQCSDDDIDDIDIVVNKNDSKSSTLPTNQNEGKQNTQTVNMTKGAKVKQKQQKQQKQPKKKISSQFVLYEDLNHNIVGYCDASHICEISGKMMRPEKVVAIVCISLHFFFILFICNLFF